MNGGLNDKLDDAYEHAESNDDAVLYAALAATSTTPTAILLKEKSRKKWESIEREMKKIEGARSIPVAPENTITIATGTDTALTTAQARINEAKERWEDGNYREALERSIEARTLVKDAEKSEKEERKEREREKDRSKKEHLNENEDKKDD